MILIIKEKTVLNSLWTECTETTGFGPWWPIYFAECIWWMDTGTVSLSLSLSLSPSVYRNVLFISPLFILIITADERQRSLHKEMVSEAGPRRTEILWDDEVEGTI